MNIVKGTNGYSTLLVDDELIGRVKKHGNYWYGYDAKGNKCYDLSRTKTEAATRIKAEYESLQLAYYDRLERMKRFSNEKQTQGIPSFEQFIS